MARPKIACVVGTRPDAIKTAPVVQELRRYEDRAETVLVSTGQHREMLDQALEAFGLTADRDLAIMRHGQTLAGVTTKALEGLDEVFSDLAPDYVIAQGDTTSTFCASIAAFYRRIPFGHVEAGLRTDSIDNPFPEEFNRRTTGLIASHHFAPTTWAAKNLISEGKDPSTVSVTGNTGIDAVLYAAQAEAHDWLPDANRVLLLTTHRRENWGEPQRRIAVAALQLIEQFPEVQLAVPMHRNPQVRDVLKRVLGDHPRVHLIEPPDYGPFVKLMQRSALILTDSGGIQEEAPAFGVPVLVLRETTERPEGVEVGTAKLVGTDTATIVQEAVRLLTDSEAYRQMAQTASPYGDGQAAQRIRKVVLGSLEVDSPEVEMWG
ncbi:MAG TPA: UDP-N-acetylglucosamine 2-epimerase (non-hydrolyzing) [Fimbriimonadaceae bacterium]|nr:UDP-N-acetylglucosamine 2-epimerase (non-hydrolyzing) [Fimbriimonadaceae bacterium]